MISIPIHDSCKLSARTNRFRDDPLPHAAHASPRIPTGIWILGLVSLFMDIATGIVNSVLPLFLVATVGAGAMAVGLVEGSARAIATVLKLFSGALSDYLGHRKGLAIIGYGLGAVSKPLLAIAPGLGTVLLAHLTDRIGKGIRGAPRDALIADLAPDAIRGAAYGLRQSLDMAGAFIGPLLAVVLMALWANDYQAIFWFTCVPAGLAVLLLTVGIREPSRPSTTRRRNPLNRANLKQLNQPYRGIVLIGALVTLARFSEAFLLLRADNGSLPLAWLPLMLVVVNLAFSLSAYPLGRLADRLSHRSLLVAGMCLLMASHLVLAISNHWLTLLLGALLWGLHLGTTQGLLSAMIAACVPADLRGTGFGFYNLITGVVMFPASLIAGLLWTLVSPAATFYGGAVFCLCAMVSIALWSPWLRRSGARSDTH